MTRLFDTYRALYDQVFVPIFVQDELDTMVLLEGCLEAGLRVIEYSLRRPDARTMIPRIRNRYPDLHLLVGSTLDDDGTVAQRQRAFPQLMTLAELDALDVDGFVSMIGWHLDTIRHYSGTRLVVPAAWTVTEAFQEVGAGAHMIKCTGPHNLELTRLLRAQPTFGFCPVLVTGGMTLERLPAAFEVGAVTVASGFDVTLRDRPGSLTAHQVAETLGEYVAVALAARNAKWPELAQAAGRDWQSWLDTLPHVHPF